MSTFFTVSVHEATKAKTVVKCTRQPIIKHKENLTGQARQASYL